MNEKHVDPIPDNFDSLEEAGEFWDSHDTTDYPDAFQTVEVNAELRVRHFEVEIDADVAKALQDKAKQQGTTMGNLASNLLRKQLAA